MEGVYDDINVMSYNLLADGHAANGRFPYASKNVLNFIYRGSRIIREI